MAGQVSEGFDSWALKEVPEKLSDFFTILDRGYEDAVKKIKKSFKSDLVFKIPATVCDTNTNISCSDR